MVICVGVPYPKLSDIKVQLKREYLNQRNKIERNGFDGTEWYREEAMNAVNQSLGRLIRHINDYGIMICFGIEFSYNIGHLSKWIKNNKIEYIRLKENDKEYYSGLNKFLNELREKIYPQYYNKNINIEENIDDFNEETEYGLLGEDYIDDNNSEESWEKVEEVENYENNIISNIDDILNFEKEYNEYNYSSLGYKRLRENKDDEENDFI